MSRSKGLSAIYLNLAHAAKDNRGSVITASILVYVAFYILISLGGFSFQVQPALAYSVEITDLNFDDSTQEHEFLVNATVRDRDGDDDIQSCNLDADNGSVYFSDSMDIIRGFGNETQSLCQYNLAYNDPTQNWEHMDSINALITAEASDSTDSISGSHTFPNHAPVFTDLSYSNYSSIHGFNVTAEISDPDSTASDEIADSCWFRFSDGDGNTALKKGEVDYSYGSGNQAACSYSNLNASMPYPGGQPTGQGFEVLEEIDIQVNASDVHGAEITTTGSNTIPNSRPFTITPQPEDEGTTSEYPVNISAVIRDLDGDEMNVTVFNERTGDVLYQEENVETGDRFRFDWNIPDATTSRYRWTVQVSDPWSSRNFTYEFRKTLESTYRTDLSVDLNYSTILMNRGNTRYTELVIRNNIQNQKNLTVNLTGVNAEFLNGDTVRNIPELGGGETREYTFRVAPDTVVEGNVTVTVVNNDLGIETVETVPVNVLPSSVESNEVPGMGYIQLMFIVLVSTSYWLFSA